MGVYNPVRVLLPNGLDEVGVGLGLFRFENEHLSDYRRRLLLEARKPSGPTQDAFIDSINRKVGQFETPVLEIDVIRDSNGNALADDPHVEVTSAFLKAYVDYENDVLDFEINLKTDGKWLKDVKAAFDTSTYYSATVIDVDYEYKKSLKLKVGSSGNHRAEQRLFSRFVNSLGRKFIRNFRANNTIVFGRPVASASVINAEGEYFIDRENGVVFSYDVQDSFVSYDYEVFPHKLMWQPIRAYTYNDSDIDHLHKDNLIDDKTGLEVPQLLNPDGARVANVVLDAHGLEWDE